MLNRIGMPRMLMLESYGDSLYYIFGAIPYLVGSALTKAFAVGSENRPQTPINDVDVRVMLTKQKWDQFGFTTGGHGDPVWAEWCKAMSYWGAYLTNMPIDFQIQEIVQANKEYALSPRSALISGIHRQNSTRTSDLLKQVNHYFVPGQSAHTCGVCGQDQTDEVHNPPK